MLVSIEGNIGSGKSTLVANLKEYFPHVILLQEPVEEWNRTGTLKYFYEKTAGQTLVRVY
jgi:deoxyadenosine/deoxycytidine kinase